jgi:mannan endo-1,4-beta-mannosidase
VAPVSPAASPAARDLLALLGRLSGRAVLAGQHNQPAHGAEWTERITELTDAVPALFGIELGFSAPGTLDAVDRREANLAEAVRWARSGAVVAVTWHAVCPLDDEPVEFAGGVVRDDFTDEQFEEVLTPGTRLHERWTAQADVAAGLLGRLQVVGVPVLWRPYTEMNGPWFWWGGRPDQHRRLWRQLFDRFTGHHGLGNLVWVWNPSAPHEGAGPFAEYHPGDDVVDVLAVDTYGGHYEPETYRDLLALAGDRPIGLGEVGELPSDAVLAEQPRWTWFMAWPDEVTATNTEERLRAVYAHPRVLTLDRLAALRGGAPG